MFFKYFYSKCFAMANASVMVVVLKFDKILSH